MRTQTARQGNDRAVPRRNTLLDLLAIVNDQTDDDAEAVDRVVDLVNSGRVVLTGNFRGERFPAAA